MAPMVVLTAVRNSLLSAASQADVKREPQTGSIHDMARTDVGRTENTHPPLN